MAQANESSPDVELPDAAALLNQLKAKRKKSKTDLQDVEGILELLPKMPMPAQQPQLQLPDLYAARDKLFDMPSFGGWSFKKGERERFYLLAEALIEEISKLDPNYTIIQRLQSDLKQEYQRAEAHLNARLAESARADRLEEKLGRRPR